MSAETWCYACIKINKILSYSNQVFTSVYNKIILQICFFSPHHHHHRLFCCHFVWKLIYKERTLKTGFILHYHWMKQQQRVENDHLSLSSSRHTTNKKSISLINHFLHPSSCSSTTWHCLLPSAWISRQDLAIRRLWREGGGKRGVKTGKQKKINLTNSPSYIDDCSILFQT